MRPFRPGSPPAAHQIAAHHRSGVPNRSGRRRDDWRHGGDARLRHDCRPRHGTDAGDVLGMTVVLADARVSTPARVRASRRLGTISRACSWDRRHAGRDHRSHRAAASSTRIRVGCGLLVRPIKGAVDTVIATIQLGVPVARMELLDEAQVDAVNLAIRMRRTPWRLRSCSSSTATASGTCRIRLSRSR